MATFTVKKQNFLEWYYNSDSDQEQEQNRISLGERVIEELMSSGKITITVEEIFEECELSCMPIHILEEFEFDYDDYIEIGDTESGIELGVDEVVLID